MHSPLAQAIRAARLASGLTQEQLGRRLGLKGRAVHRWERGRSAPRRRHRRELVLIINALSPTAATALAAVFTSTAKDARGAAAVSAVGAPAPGPPAIDPRLAFQFAAFAMADELDVPARRLRSGLIKLIKRMREANLTLDTLQCQLEEWNDPALTGVNS